MIRRDGVGVEVGGSGAGGRWKRREGSSVDRVGFRWKDSGGWTTWPGMSACFGVKAPKSLFWRGRHVASLRGEEGSS